MLSILSRRRAQPLLCKMNSCTCCCGGKQGSKLVLGALAFSSFTVVFYFENNSCLL